MRAAIDATRRSDGTESGITAGTSANSHLPERGWLSDRACHSDEVVPRHSTEN